MLNWAPRWVEESILAVAITLLSIPIVAQETKPVPKDSVRVAIPGCTKGQIFTAAPPH
jgi:hypothetical protein